MKFSTFEEWAADWPRDAYFEIIGIVADAKNSGLQDAARPEMYFPDTVTGSGARQIMVRTASNSTLALESLRREIAEMDSDVAVSDAGSIETSLKRWYYAGPQFTIIILTTFGAVGLLLVLMGIFSVMAYTVSLRTHEIGIRMALGALQRDVLRMVQKKGLVLIAAGTIAGLAAGLALTRLMSSQIWVSHRLTLGHSSLLQFLYSWLGLQHAFFQRGERRKWTHWSLSGTSNPASKKECSR